METFELSEQQKTKLDTAITLVEDVRAMQVTNPRTHTLASETLVVLQTKIKEVEDMRNEIVDPIKAAKQKIEQARKKAVQFFDRVLVPLEQIKSGLDKKMVSWRREERRKAELEAERKRAAELKKIEEQRQKTERVAQGLEKKGLAEDAAAVRDKEASRPAPAPVEVQPRITTVSGASVKIEYVAEVNEQRQQITLGKIIDDWNAKTDPEYQLVPAKFWMLNKKALDSFGKKTEGQVKIPGVRWVEDEKTVARRRR